MHDACASTAWSKRFGAKTAVDGLSFRVPPGMLYAFLGPNGAGKTTTLRMIAGLIEPGCGRASRVERHRRHRRARRRARSRSLAYHAQTIRCSTAGSTRWNTWSSSPAFGAHRSRRSPESDAQELLERLGLWDRRHEWLETYSRGMKQKVALASALIHRTTTYPAR